MHMDRSIKMVRLDLASAYEQKKIYPEAIAQWQGGNSAGWRPSACRWRNLLKLRNLLDQLPKDPLAGEQPYRMRSC